MDHFLSWFGFPLKIHSWNVNNGLLRLVAMKLAGGMDIAVSLIPLVLLLITHPQKAYIYIYNCASEAYQLHATTPRLPACWQLYIHHTMNFIIKPETRINRISPSHLTLSPSLRPGHQTTSLQPCDISFTNTNNILSQ